MMAPQFWGIYAELPTAIQLRKKAAPRRFRYTSQHDYYLPYPVTNVKSLRYRNDARESLSTAGTDRKRKCLAQSRKSCLRTSAISRSPIS